MKDERGRPRTKIDARCEERVAAVRSFNRFYTRKIGVLSEHLLGSPFALAGVRVLYELAHWPADKADPATASELAARLGLDEGYLSRILRGFEERGFLRKKTLTGDGRRKALALSDRGSKLFASLDARSHEEMAALLADLPEADQIRLVGAMRTVEQILDRSSAKPGSRSAYVLRPPQPGDIGWVIHRHGVLYAGEYGYDEQFEALVAEIAARFVQRFDPKRERCWIAERDGEIAGSVFLVRKSAKVAKLRLLLVEPQARGLGIGRRLVDECVRFARAAGYTKLTLWTQNDLYAARHLYALAGFRCVDAQPHESFGKKLVAETWELALEDQPAKRAARAIRRRRR